MEPPSLYDCARTCEEEASRKRLFDAEQRRVQQGLPPGSTPQGGIGLEAEFEAQALERAAKLVRAVEPFEKEVRELIVRLKRERER